MTNNKTGVRESPYTRISSFAVSYKLISITSIVTSASKRLPAVSSGN